VENIKIVQIKTKENLRQVLQKIKVDKEIRVLILSFIDEKAFSAKTVFDEDLIKQIENFPIPIITIIKEFAGGLLFEILLATHLCIISDSVRFEISNKEKIKKHCGSKKVKILKTIEDKIDAKTALEWGMVNKIMTSENAEKEALEMAENISRLAPLAIKACLKAVNQGLAMELEEGLKLETRLFSAIFSTKDMKEGTSAFLEKRQPHFCGK